MKIISNQTLTYVLEAGRSVAPVLKSGDIVILESTSPVGTTETLRDLLAAERPDCRFALRSDPGGAQIFTEI